MSLSLGNEEKNNDSSVTARDSKDESSSSDHKGRHATCDQLG